MKSLYDYAKEQGATGVKKINAGNGAFIVMSKLPKADAKRFTAEDKTQMTIPVGKRSQDENDLSQYNVLISDGRNGGTVGQAIATINTVEVLAEVDF